MQEVILIQTGKRMRYSGNLSVKVITIIEFFSVQGPLEEAFLYFPVSSSLTFAIYTNIM